MLVQRWSIVRRHRHTEFDIVAPTDFRLRRPVTVSEESVVSNPHVSLYCLDFENERALFVETPSDADVEAAPFFYAAQFHQAVAVVTVPFGVFHRVAPSLPVNLGRIVLVYSVGRCGSTLLSAAFRAAPTVRSFSEPDVFSQLLAYQGWNHEREDTIRALLGTCVRWLCRSTPGSPTEVTCVIKFRAFGISLAVPLTHVVPSAHLLFLYRDARPWFRSVFRAFLRDVDLDSTNLLRNLEIFFSRMIRLVADYRGPDQPLRLTQIWGLQWVDAMEQALALQQRQVPMLIMRYEDLLRAPEAAIHKILAHCNLDVATRDILAAMTADSQSGTSVARTAIGPANTTVPAPLLDEAMNIIGTRPIIHTPDFVLPGTWVPPADAVPVAGGR